ncbi:CDP-glycerol glycerophosphotransferase family protein [Bacillus alkalisoli]|uniref:CDP-glycerol glycerophosphotransferase family protein n=1 Tax=Bacillus alkalisoli TaxID=2011008 RepID=UPI000C246791|nr:CDP-glycerol glycerophosphotransferase family protein [Bacillus alkalisoli]
MEGLYTWDNTHLKFGEGYCDFNGTIHITNRKIKENHKYYVYNKETRLPVRVEQKSKMEIVEVVKERKYQVIFYVDSNKRLSFIKAKYHSVLGVDEIVDKIEKTPFYRVSIFSVFQALIFFGVLRFRYYSFEEIDLSFGYNKSVNVKVNFLFPKKIRSKFAMKTNIFALIVHFFWCSVPFKVLLNQYKENSEINVPVFIRIKNDKYNYYFNLKENTKDKFNKSHYLFNTSSYFIRYEPIELFVRKSITGQFVIVFTSELKKLIVLKERIAYILSKFTSNKDKFNVYFEKFCEGASESGFELFKFAVKTDENARYILDSKNEQFQQLKLNYPNKILAKNSIKAFYTIFKAKSFISSDLVTHIQRRLYDNDTLIKNKILNNTKKIFLQHGVCLATNVFERGYYNTRVPIAPDYILVNSDFEADMFEKYSDYKRDNLIKTGLPNLDLYVKSRTIKKDAITFLLTWRPWDLTGKIEEGSYISRYLQFINMVKSNDFYSNKKINIVLHPKSKIILKEQFPEIYFENEKYFYDGDIKDALLKTKVLISDYSSVTFYGFTGGSNIVFYWEDKMLAEQEYGAPNILQEEIAFGDIVYKFDQLQETIVSNYSNQQDEYYKSVFEKLVECQEGNNTEETYNYLKEKIL